MPSALAKSLRMMRFLENVRGWGRLVNTLSPPAVAPFVVEQDGVVFSGCLSSHIDRQVWFFGRYERRLIEMFLAAVDLQRRGVCLDIGGNVGNHALAFGTAFSTVHTFEPNPEVLDQLRMNVSLNPNLDIRIHPFGLGDQDGELPFYNIRNGNLGLGTFSNVEQYDQPLIRIGEAKIHRGDDFVRSLSIDRVDAIKIDVQGFEPEVIRGLADTLERDRPVVWVEVGDGTKASMSSLDGLQSLFPYPINVSIMEGGKVEPILAPGNYLCSPAI